PSHVHSDVERLPGRSHASARSGRPRRRPRVLRTRPRTWSSARKPARRRPSAEAGVIGAPARTRRRRRFLFLGGVLVVTGRGGRPQTGPLQQPLGAEVALIGTTDIANVAEPLLLGRGLEDEVPEAQDPTDVRLADRDVQGP